MGLNPPRPTGGDIHAHARRIATVSTREADRLIARARVASSQGNGYAARRDARAAISLLNTARRAVETIAPDPARTLGTRDLYRRIGKLAGSAQAILAANTLSPSRSTQRSGPS